VNEEDFYVLFKILKQLIDHNLYTSCNILMYINVREEEELPEMKNCILLILLISMNEQF